MQIVNWSCQVLLAGSFEGWLLKRWEYVTVRLGSDPDVKWACEASLSRKRPSTLHPNCVASARTATIAGLKHVHRFSHQEASLQCGSFGFNITTLTSSTILDGVRRKSIKPSAKDSLNMLGSRGRGFWRGIEGMHLWRCPKKLSTHYGGTISFSIIVWPHRGPVGAQPRGDN